MTAATARKMEEARPVAVNLPFASAAVLPAQMTGRFQAGARLQPEKRLMLAVLEDAIEIYLREAARPAGRASPEFAAAAAWLRSPDDHWPFSFVGICRVLGLEPSAIRRGLTRCVSSRPAGDTPVAGKEVMSCN